MSHKSKSFEKVAKKQRGAFKKSSHEQTEYQRERDNVRKKRKHQREAAWSFEMNLKSNPFNKNAVEIASTAFCFFRYIFYSTGLMFQISLAYSIIERSLEK